LFAFEGGDGGVAGWDGGDFHGGWGHGSLGCMFRF
jgi:hypothetical protein